MTWMIVLGDRDAISWVVASRRMAFREHVPTNELRVGDQVLLYSTRGAFKNPTRDEPQIFAAGFFASRVEHSRVAVAGETFTKWCRLEITHLLPPREGIGFRPFVPRLRFIKNKETWPAALRRTLIRLPERDFKVLARALEREATSRSSRRPQAK